MYNPELGRNLFLHGTTRKIQIIDDSRRKQFRKSCKAINFPRLFYFPLGLHTNTLT